MLIALIILFSSLTQASFPPDYPWLESRLDYYEIGPDENRGSEVDEDNFNLVINRVFKLYEEDAPKLGRQMKIEIADWQQPYFSAWAIDHGDDLYSINFWGGFARLPDMTIRGFVLTTCHEVGHILGGSPYHLSKHHKNMSSEGQADYFASALCFKAYNQIFPFSLVRDLDPYAIGKCYEKFQTGVEFEECLQVAQAGLDLSRVLAFLGDVHNPLFSTPSLSISETTLFDSYPTVQCRLDTYLAGASSRFNIKSLLQSQDKHLRPECWFKTDQPE